MQGSNSHALKEPMLQTQLEDGRATAPATTTSPDLLIGTNVGGLHGLVNRDGSPWTTTVATTLSPSAQSLTLRWVIPCWWAASP